MIPYWVILALPVLAMAMSADRPERRHPLPLWLFAGLLALMIGSRYRVGADWFAYLRYIGQLGPMSFGDALFATDPAYGALTWLMANLGAGITGVNLVCGAIFCVGLADFAWRMPNPWLAVTVAIPYLVVVVAMGYTRQAVALGFEFVALGQLAQGRYRNFFVCVLCAAAFHKTAILLSLLGIFSGPKPFTLGRALLGGSIVYLSVRAFLLEHYEGLIRHYVEGQLDSTGAQIRVMMNALPAALLLVLYRVWNRRQKVVAPWLVFALGSLGCVALVQAATTAVDRMALYLAPLQLYVWSHVPLLSRSLVLRPLIVLYHAAVLFVWLEFATHARFWIPYRSVWFL